MKKVATFLVLGIALLSEGRPASAEQNRGKDARPQFGQQSAQPVPLDFARWLARRLNEGPLAPFPLDPSPKTAPLPFPGANPVAPNEVCNPERSHCPTG